MLIYFGPIQVRENEKFLSIRTNYETNHVISITINSIDEMENMNRVHLINILAFMSFLPGCIDGGDHLGGYGPMGGWMHYGCGYGGIFMWILILIVIGVAAYLIIQNARLHGIGSTSHETPLEILKKRYAKGEISKEEFDRMKNDLQ